MSNYARLRCAVLAYAEALKRYGIVGSAWVEHSDDLDELWDDVLEAARPEPDEPANRLNEPQGRKP